MPRRVLVFGPAYLDRVLRVDRPLLPDRLGRGPLDLSVGGRWSDEVHPDSRLVLADPSGLEFVLELPEDWHAGGPSRIALDRPLLSGPELRARGDDPVALVRSLKVIDWCDDLGGMGAGFAAALNGTLVSALGPESDSTSARIAALLAEHGIVHLPARVPDRAADWTLLLSSGPHGDKLPVGFRGCHAALGSYPGPRGGVWDVLVVASLTNRLARSALESVDARVRVLAPTVTNMTDRTPPVSSFADRIDLLACNRQEWEALADRDRLAEVVPIVSITDGPAGGLIRYRDRGGETRIHLEPAFPRDRPPRDTNRAGEAFASTLLTTLLDAGWLPGPVDEDRVRLAARRASAAAGLVIDREHFGFPTPDEIDHALAAGRIR